MKKFIENNGQVRVVNMEEGFLKDEFSPAIYSVRQDMSGLYLSKEMDRFEMPKEVYGSTPERANKIMSTYHDRDGTTGVLLTGLKGAGKTFLIKYTGNLALEEGIPVVTINDPMAGDEFLAFIDSLGPCMLIFDEFAKNYKRAGDNGQDALLTLFDGVAGGKRLIMLSENNRWDVSDLYKDRPSRVYYSYSYEKLEKDIIEEFSMNNLINKDFTEKIMEMSNRTLEFSFDILQSVIEECNRYPDMSFDKIVSDLNISLGQKDKYLHILSARGKPDSFFESITFTPDKNPVEFNDFYASVFLLEDGDVSADNRQRQYFDVGLYNFIRMVGDIYIFEQNGIELKAKMIESTFSDRPEIKMKRRSDSLVESRANATKEDVFSVQDAPL
jgi:hypothetical protein